MLYLGKYNNISFSEVLYVMIEKEVIRENYNDIENVIYYEMNDYYLFYNNEEFRETIIINENIYIEFKVFHELFSDLI